jgi:hypothetical protein
MHQYARSSILVHEGIKDRLDDVYIDRGWAASMSSNSLDWPTVLLEVGNSIIQSVIEIPHGDIFQPINKNNTTTRVRVFLSHYFDHIPNIAELQYEEFNCMRCIVIEAHKCTTGYILKNDRQLLTMLSDVYPSLVCRHGSNRRSCLPDASNLGSGQNKPASTAELNHRIKPHSRSCAAQTYQVQTLPGGSPSSSQTAAPLATQFTGTYTNKLAN